MSFHVELPITRLCGVSNQYNPNDIIPRKAVPNSNQTVYVTANKIELVSRFLKVHHKENKLPYIWQSIKIRVLLPFKTPMENRIQNGSFNWNPFTTRPPPLVFPVSLKYDKLFGICKLCSSLCHDEDHCPLNPKSVDKKTDSREELANKKEDRARSYKGVVIHGEESQQERGTDQRNYYGKGKGKMHEDQDSKWVRVPERGNKRYSSYHDNNRNDEGNNRHRNTRWEQPRSYVQESREKGHRGTRRERSPPHYAREEPKEEGELQDTGSANKGSQMEGKTSASNNLQIESNGARANLIKLPPKSVEMENGAIAAIVSGTVGAGKGTEPPLGDNGKDMEENEVMDLAENVIPSAGDKGCMGEDEAFENLTDGEMEELNGSQEVVLETVEEESRPTDVEEKELQVGEEEKKKGARKILKHTMAAGASKKKFVQALLSQNKNTQARQGKRQGDGSKLQEDKGSSYPKQTSSKNSTASHG
ncbi:hypothetical protein YC2023_046862 [Brassica napus]